ncbi:MAG: hypothetical protein AAFR33_09055 [Pseudomonadota bacterium]
MKYSKSTFSQEYGYESHIIQALLCEIGSKMGFRIWLPKADREHVKAASASDYSDDLLETLPLQYNDVTVRIIEQIDVLWLKLNGRSIARAFEVEYTTAIYFGLLRMADLVALQPDMHILAPEERQSEVMKQFRRPVFSMLDTGPLSSRGSIIGYSDIGKLAETPHLQHMSDAILSETELIAHD